MVTRMIMFVIAAFIAIGLTGCSTAKESPKSQEKLEVKDSQSEAIHMIANDEKIIEMLKKNGEIPENATQEEINKALQKYLKNKAPGNLEDEKAKKNYINELKDKIQKDKKTSE